MFTTLIKMFIEFYIFPLDKRHIVVIQPIFTGKTLIYATYLYA